MDYFGGLDFHSFNHIPACTASLDQTFDVSAVNFIFARQMRFRAGEEPEVVLEGPTAFWTHPGRRYVYGASPGESWDHYFVAFRGPRVRRWRQARLFPGETDGSSYCRIEHPSELREHFERLLRELARHPSDPSSAVHLLEGVLLLLVTQPQQARAEVDSELESCADALAERIRSQPAKGWDISAEAQRLGYSYAHLRRVFRRRTGLPPHQFVIKARLDDAAELLRSTPKPIKTIASHVGFDDVFHFSKLFRAHYGRPPASYRRAMQLSP
jgi:AraC-like DNA-binding protein